MGLFCSFGSDALRARQRLDTVYLLEPGSYKHGFMHSSNLQRMFGRVAVYVFVGNMDIQAIEYLHAR